MIRDMIIIIFFFIEHLIKLFKGNNCKILIFLSLRILKHAHRPNFDEAFLNIVGNELKIN